MGRRGSQVPSRVARPASRQCPDIATGDAKQGRAIPDVLIRPDSSPLIARGDIRAGIDPPRASSAAAGRLGSNLRSPVAISEHCELGREATRRRDAAPAPDGDATARSRAGTGVRRGTLAQRGAGTGGRRVTLAQRSPSLRRDPRVRRRRRRAADRQASPAGPGTACRRGDRARAGGRAPENRAPRPGPGDRGDPRP